MKKQQLDDAWLKMQDRLKQEPESAKWTAFSERSRQENESPAERLQESNLAQKETGKASIHLSAPSAEQNKAKRAWSEWLQQRKRWIAGTAAAIVLGVALATPAGNQVFASLLNQFRMEQLTVVKEQDLENLFNSIEGASESTMNQYGEFAHFSEGDYVSYSTIEVLQENVGRELVIPEIFRSEEPQNLRIGVSPSRTITMKVNVNEINDTMRKLGADKLLPLSIDGKQITLTMGKAVSFDLYPNKTQTSYNLSQQPTPSITVEAGVPMAEALEAVLQFPLIPTHLKQELKQSHVLDSGSAPLPIVMPDGYEQIQIANIEVLLTDLNTANGSYSAVWANDGQLFTFSGTFPDRDAFTSMLKEMIGS
ncbi:hypothetical protein [Paenibacillus sp. Soil522]|uniref:hypothetical protein n=1 Tax=Paenibacillus sp. Soil522 TaxID=1736388 RepID=UPI0006FF88ED|nr:hypothetical protein [Paenibacillus sp. Soil522]KRE53562.1 hypothetical protein ASG81_02020 [Paenibacillus sp. Soil522]